MTTAWLGWFGLGGQIKGKPVAVAPTHQTIDVYARGADNRLVQKWWDGSTWHPSADGWFPHDDGFLLGSSPSVISNGADQRDVYVRGQDGRVHHKIFSNGKWSKWFGLGGKIKGEPCAIAPTSATIDIYARGVDDRLLQKWWDGKNWHPSAVDWFPHEDGGFRLGSPPSAVSEGAGIRDVYIRGQDGGVYHKFFANGAWSPWHGLGGNIAGAPLVIVPAPGVRDIYACGADKRIWQKAWDGKTWTPSDLGWMLHNDGNFRAAEGPGGYARDPLSRDIYVRGLDKSVLHKFWQNKRHSNPVTIRPNPTQSVTIDANLLAAVRDNEPGVAVAVIKNGEIAYLNGRGLTRKGGPPITSETMFHLASAGKQFTGLGIAMLDEDPAVDFNVGDQLRLHLPELAGYSQEVTIVRLLHHLSGVFDMYSDQGASAIQKHNAVQPTNADLLRAVTDLGCPMDASQSAPGRAHVYNNTGYDLLGSVIERVSGQTYPNFFHSRVFRPLGMTDSFALPDISRLGDANRAMGHEMVNNKLQEQSPNWMDHIYGAGTFYSSVFDLAAYDVGFASNHLVSAATKARIIAGARTTLGDPVPYGFGWALGEESGSYHEHGGAWCGFASYIRRYDDNRLSVYILSNRSDMDLIGIMQAAVASYR